MEKRLMYNYKEGIEAEKEIRNKINEMKLTIRLYEYSLESRHLINLSNYGDTKTRTDFFVHVNDKIRLYLNSQYDEKNDLFLFYFMDRRIYPSIITRIDSIESLDEAMNIFADCYIDFFDKVKKLVKDKKGSEALFIMKKKETDEDSKKVYFSIDEVNNQIKSERPIEMLIKYKSRKEIATMLFDSKKIKFEIDSILEVKDFDEEKYWVEDIG